MSSSKHLNQDQFPDFPYPRLRENFSTIWSDNMADIVREDDPLIDTRMVLPTGEHQAKSFVEMALADPTDTSTRQYLIDTGFKQRKRAKALRSSWVN